MLGYVTVARQFTLCDLVFAITAEVMVAATSVSDGTRRYREHEKITHTLSFRSKAVVCDREVMYSSLSSRKTERPKLRLPSCAKPAHFSSEQRLCLQIQFLLHVHSSSINAFVADLPQTCVILDQRQ